MNSANETSGSAASSRRGTGARFLVTLISLALLAMLGYCSPRPSLETPSAPETPGASETPGIPVVAAAPARLRVEVEPAGARILVDGLRSGTTPLSVELPAGPHTVRVEMEGYEPLERAIELIAGETLMIAADLRPAATPRAINTPRAFLTTLPNDKRLADLLVRGVTTTLETGGDCDYSNTNLGSKVVIENAGVVPSVAFVLELNGTRYPVTSTIPAGDVVAPWFPQYAYGGETIIVLDVDDEVEESNEENNTWQGMVAIPTLPPTCTPLPTPTYTPTPLPPSSVSVRQGQVTIATYPYANFMTSGYNAQYNMTYPVLDRGAYNGSGPVPSNVTYDTLIVENEYLALTFLPELGGRLYEIWYKPTGHRETYRNPVLKPSPWGPPEQGWWLAAGGIEWCLPVEEHGYEWGVPWQVETLIDDEGVTVLLRDSTATDRVRAVVAVRLEAGTSAFTIRPRIENPTSAALPVKYWINAMLTPGGHNAPTAGLRFVLHDAITSVTVHSRGDDDLPQPGQRMSWPVAAGRDLSYLGNWIRWLGFFEDPAAGDFMAVYDEGYDEGVVRSFAAADTPGAKMFAFGWQDPIGAGNWTDDGSSYVEMHGGAAPTFDTTVTIPAGGHIQWTETWYPVSGLGGLRYANALAALNLTTANGTAHLAVATTRRWAGDVVLTLDGNERLRQRITLVPGQTWVRDLPLGGDAPLSGCLSLSLQNNKGRIVAEYQVTCQP